MRKKTLIQTLAAVLSAVLIAALAIGPAGANHCSGCIDKGDIATNAVGSSEIRTGAVGKSEIRADAVGGSELRDDSVDGNEIVDGSVGLADLAFNSVAGTRIIDASVGVADLASSAKTKVVAGFRDTAVSIAGTTFDDLLGLSLTSGSWLIVATTLVNSDTAAKHAVTCRLAAGATFDEKAMRVDGSTFDREAAAFHIVHTFGFAGGTAILRCDDDGNAASVEDTKIAAIRLEGGFTNGDLTSL